MDKEAQIKALEAALLDYIERYGFTEKAREYFLGQYRDDSRFRPIGQ